MAADRRHHLDVQVSFMIDGQPIVLAEYATKQSYMKGDVPFGPADEAAADEKFGNKLLKVTGIVNRIESKVYNDFAYINLTNTENNLLEHIRCFFDKKHSPELDELTPGQEITVQGTFDGSVVSMRLKNCALVH